MSAQRSGPHGPDHRGHRLERQARQAAALEDVDPEILHLIDPTHLDEDDTPPPRRDTPKPRPHRPRP